MNYTAKADITKENNSLFRIWGLIRDELLSLQVRTDNNKMNGGVVNPVANLVYAQNTGAAALVFTTEFLRTGDEIWLEHAGLSMDNLKAQRFHSGLNEPKWYRLGWEYHKGSLFSTGTLLDSYWNTLNCFRKRDDENKMFDLAEYVSSCKIKPGLYAHDKVLPGQKHVNVVQNTTAIALFLQEMVAAYLKDYKDDKQERNMIFEHLMKGQRNDGFWPYLYPDVKQQMFIKYRMIRYGLRIVPFLNRYFNKPGDRSIWFGDGVHHCLVLYYLLKSIDIREPDGPWKGVVQKAWDWVKGKLVQEKDGLRFDFEWEPYPMHFRWGNFRDTSTYFLILACLPFLRRFGINGSDHSIDQGLLNYVSNKLTIKDDRFPTCIVPYEGSDHIIKFVLPRVGEAAAWKGALLAEYICNENISTDKKLASQGII